jgi:hypothetical protein
MFVILANARVSQPEMLVLIKRFSIGSRTTEFYEAAVSLETLNRFRS